MARTLRGTERRQTGVRGLAREGGGIGRRTGFRFQRRKAWGFESLPSHQRTGFSGMQTSIEALSRLERRLNMAVPAEQIDREVDQRLRKLSRTVRKRACAAVGRLRGRSARPEPPC